MEKGAKVKIIVSTKGVHTWEVSVENEDHDKALAESIRLDAELTKKYGAPGE